MDQRGAGGSNTKRTRGKAIDNSDESEAAIMGSYEELNVLVSFEEAKNKNTEILIKISDLIEECRGKDSRLLNILSSQKVT